MDLIQKLEAYQRVQNRIDQLQQKGREQEANQLRDVLDKVTKQNIEPSVVQSSVANSEIAEISQLLKGALKELKILIDIKATASITYDAIKLDWVKKRLLADNFRMEQSYANLTISDTERFHSFCSSAFKQVENLLNYYYYLKHPIFSDCIAYFKSKNTKFPDNRDPNELSQIAAHSKLNCFEQEYYYDNSKQSFYESKLELVRHVRNLDSHRCDVLVKDYDKTRTAYQDLLNAIKNAKEKNLTYTKSKKDFQIEKEGKIALFLKEQNFDLVRDEVKVLYEKVTRNIE